MKYLNSEFSSKAIVTMQSAVQLIYQYCDMLPKDQYCDVKPVFNWEEGPKLSEIRGEPLEKGKKN
jgi:Dicer dimerisation domain